MKRKFEIPQMSTDEISRWYTTIKPIVKQTDYADKVDFSKLY